MATGLTPLTYIFGPYRLDSTTGQLHLGGHVVSLQPRPIAVLRALMDAAGNLVTKEELVQRVWDGAAIEDSNITKCIAEIRQALRPGFRELDPVVTVWKQGYRFVVPVEIEALEPIPTIDLPPPVPSPQRFSSAQLAAAVIAAIMVCAVFVPYKTPAATKTRSNVALLGIRNLSPNRTDDWMAAAFMETLTAELQADSNIHAPSTKRVAQVVTGLSLLPSYPWDAATMHKAAAELSVNTAVTGTYLVNAEEVRLDLRISDTATGETLASVSQTGSLDALLDLAARTGVALRRALGQDGARLSTAPVPQISADALRRYALDIQRMRQYDSAQSDTPPVPPTQRHALN